jgi:phage portal protein BeeE
MGFWERFGIGKKAASAPQVEAVDVAAVCAQAEADALQRVSGVVQEALERAQGPGMAGAYAFANAPYYQPTISPERRPYAPVSISTLRALADNYDILRACIEQLKREVAVVPIQVVSRTGKKDEAAKARIAQAQFLFSEDGPVGRASVPYDHFEQSMLEDSCVVGCAAIFHRRNRGGGWLDCDVIDAATIAIPLDSFGWEADGGLYEQWIQGQKVRTFTGDDISYDKLYAVSYQPYGRSPVEWLIHSVNRALRVDGWNLTWFTEGTTPADLLGLPEAWSADDVIKFTNWFDSLSGNTSARVKTRFVPGGTTRLGSKSGSDVDFTPQELWLLRRTCAIMGVQPASIGFTGEQYKVSQDESMHATSRFGVGVLLRLRKRRLDDILKRAGFGELETFIPEGETEKPKDRAAREQTEVQSGVRTINEVREARDLPPVEGGDTPLVQGTLKPLADVLEPPDPTSLPPDPLAQARADLKRWERKALTRFRESHSASCEFVSEHLPAALVSSLLADLPGQADPAAIKALFRAAEETL